MVRPMYGSFVFFSSAPSRGHTATSVAYASEHFGQTFTGSKVSEAQHGEICRAHILGDGAVAHEETLSGAHLGLVAYAHSPRERGEAGGAVLDELGASSVENAQTLLELPKKRVSL